MKIAFIDEVFYPVIGGGEIFCLEVGKRLAKRHDVHVFTSRVSGLPLEETIDRIKIHRMNVSSKKLPFLINAPRAFRKYNLNFDVICSTSPVSRFVAGKIKGDSKFVCNVFAYWGDSWKEFQNPLSAFFRKSIENYSLTSPHYDLIVSSNAAFRPIAKKLGITAPVEVVPSGVDLKRFQKRHSRMRIKFGLANDGVVLFVGRVIDIKGLKYLVRALANTGYILMIVGEGPELPKIKKLASKLNVKLILPGTKAKVEEYYNIANVLAVPSIMEGCPLVILEAMASGLPVVASNVAGIPEIVENGKDGFLVPPKDVIALRESLRKILSDDILHKVMSKRALAKAANFSWDRIAADYAKILKSL
ncbi:MAG: glycosyltransferase family 4 protein [archaeon]